MGLFDYISAKCECGKVAEFQSKSGPCQLTNYALDIAPESVLHDANRHSPIFCECGNWLRIDISSRKMIVVDPPEPGWPLFIRLDDKKVLDTKRINSEGGGRFEIYRGTKKCGQFDPDYFV